MVVIALSMQCEGAVASILPTTSLMVFGVKRGMLVYSFMMSSFAISSLAGAILVKLFQNSIGYSGMLLICFILTSISALLTIKYGDIRYNYVKGLEEENAHVSGYKISG
jgi:predicted MFS family arabinose efflux permease